MEKLQGSGLDNLYLENGYLVRETRYGRGVSIKEIDNLYKAISEVLCVGDFSLTPAAFKFLRKRLELSQDALGAEFGCTGQAVAKWEKGEIEIPVAASRLLRLLVMRNLFPGRSINESFSRLTNNTMTDLVFTYSGYGWTEKSKLVKHSPKNWQPQPSFGVAAVFNTKEYAQTNDHFHELNIEGQDESESIAA